ncbi:ubiquinol oxidase subunit II [Rhizobium sp. S152]|uniref:ubiquinol oxidase subunit II n=1 Tax=Rhizobium sp. S152 TaxID=3055038 RepID=UPI0025A9EF68|nr:ubiquinol oxidase subunit II [Rhizobium sp. S152]MDM9627809.1 ubiquinol oxidase subunit II [Rhizobium sp. S152]
MIQLSETPVSQPFATPDASHAIRKQRQRKPYRVAAVARSIRKTGLATVVLQILTGCSGGVMDPRGPIAAAQREILLNSVAIMLCIIIPVIAATLLVAWWFRETNRQARYLPDWTYSGKVELVVWGIPAMVIILLGGIAWIGSHELDPARPIPSAEQPLKVEVVALDWKWLFIYPDQGLASVNRLVIPAGRPVSLRLTSASVMNSFFVPQLAGQIYAMSGMTTSLHLLAEHQGQFKGLSSQFSGDGFSGMRFNVDSVEPAEFDGWVSVVRAGGGLLDTASYQELAKPSQYVAPMAFATVEANLFESIVNTTTAAMQQDAFLDLCRGSGPISNKRF